MPKYILTVTFFLLTVTTHISAQAINSKVTFEGLRDIGLIVKYDQADGPEPAQQPIVLQKLQARARELLRQGEVPILQSANEADMVGRPRLVFTLMLRKQTDISPAIGIDGKLYQRARLLRDPAQEMELATYDSGVVGTKITEQELLALFERLVKGFVTEYREANPTPPSVESRTAEPPAQPRYNSNSLQGLNGVQLLYSAESIQFKEGTREVTGAVSNSAYSILVRTEVENRLKQAGITLLGNRPEHAGSPLLTVTVTLSAPRLDGPEISIRSTLYQWISLVRDPQKETPAVTWASRTTESAPITEESVRKVLNNHLDEFIKAYSAANPNLPSPPKVKAP